MGDYYPARVTIGGPVPGYLLRPLARVIEAEGVYDNSSGNASGAEGNLEEDEAYSLLVEQATAGESVELADNEASGGELGGIKQFLTENRIPYIHESEPYQEWDGSLEVFDGKEHRHWLCDRDGEAHVPTKDLQKLIEAPKGVVAGRSPAFKLKAITEKLAAMIPPALPPLSIAWDVPIRIKALEDYMAGGWDLDKDDSESDVTTYRRRTKLRNIDLVLQFAREEDGMHFSPKAMRLLVRREAVAGRGKGRRVDYAEVGISTYPEQVIAAVYKEGDDLLAEYGDHIVECSEAPTDESKIDKG